MSQIEIDHACRLFDRMDHWRHFPNYQLERRADLFFSLYLPEVLSEYLPFQVDEHLVPEFPIRKGAIHEDGEDDSRSVKADYLALSADRKTAILVELKTDMGSRNEKQDEYLKLAQGIPFDNLLKGLLEIFGKTQAKRKYFALLDDLRDLGQLEILPAWDEMMRRGNLQGLTALACTQPIEISSEVGKENTWVVYVQPVQNRAPATDDRMRHITFEEAARIVERHDDPLSKRFAQSLREWAEIRAGENRSG